MKITTLPLDIIFLILDQLPSPVDKTCLRHSHPSFLHLHGNYNITTYDHYFLRGDYGLISPLASRQPLKIACNEPFPAVVADGLGYRAEYILRCFPDKNLVVGETEETLKWKLKNRFVERIDMIRLVDWEGVVEKGVKVGVVMRMKRSLVNRWNGLKGCLWSASLRVERVMSGFKMVLSKVKQIKWSNRGGDITTSGNSVRITSVDICEIFH